MDPITIALLGSGIISSVGSMLTNSKQLEYNHKEAMFSRQFSREEAQKNRDFEAAQAQITRDWQTDMSNSAYQRSMVDMEKAGINPNILSSGALGAATGNAATPQGSQAQTSAASSGNLENVFGNISSALNAYATIQNQQLIAEMYNDTSRANNSFTNTIRRYGIDKYSQASKYRTDRTSANFEKSVWKYRPTSSR